MPLARLALATVGIRSTTFGCLQKVSLFGAAALACLGAKKALGHEKLADIGRKVVEVLEEAFTIFNHS